MGSLTNSKIKGIVGSVWLPSPPPSEPYVIVSHHTALQCLRDRSNLFTVGYCPVLWVSYMLRLWAWDPMGRGGRVLGPPRSLLLLNLYYWFDRTQSTTTSVRMAIQCYHPLRLTIVWFVHLVLTFDICSNQSRIISFLFLGSGIVV
jgi:hypothetical protein